MPACRCSTMNWKGSRRFGTTSTPMPVSSMLGTFTVDDVRQMVAFKRRQWEGTQYQAHLNPNTLLSPYHLEAYIAESKLPPATRRVGSAAFIDEELASYAS